MVGSTIGKYHVLDRIGRGGMGTVYRAVDEILHREVAIKVLNSELNDPEVAKRFRAEAVTVARLSHPGIATIYELFQHDGQWMMVMEFVRGETLEHLVERMGSLSPQRAAELCMQALTALAHAHSMGVIHRDLKPANLMVTESGAVKIMDFGIARVSGSEHLTNAGFMMGTPAYMAPEQVLGHEIDARADLYALGVVFYRLTTAKLPFKGDTPFAMAQSQVNDPPTPLGMLRPDLPPWADQVVQRALAKAPVDRFQSAVEFYEAFSRCLAGLPMTAVYNPSGPTELLHTPAQPMPTAAIPQGTRPPGQSSGQMPIPGQTLPPAYGGETASRVTSSGRTPQPTGPVAAPPPPPGPPTPASTSTSGSVPAAAPPVPPAPPGATTPGTAPAAAIPKQPKLPKIAQKKTNDIAIVALAGVAILLLAVLAFLWIRSHRPQPVVQTAEATPTPVATPTTTPEPTVTVPPPDVPMTAATPSPTSAVTTQSPTPTIPASPSATPTPKPAETTSARGATATTSPAPTASRSDARGTTTPRPTPTPSASSTPIAPVATPTDTPDARGRAAAAATPTPTPTATPEEPLAFQDIKLLSVNGKKATDQDVLIAFGGGQIIVTAKAGGSAIVTVPYKTIAHATYVHAKDPKWDATLPAPVDKLDLPGLIHTSQHWLALQTHQMYVILRLQDNNWERIVEAVESRSGLKVDRAADK